MLTRAAKPLPSASGTQRGFRASQSRTPLVCRAYSTSRSASPRSDWRSSWRTDAEEGTNGAEHNGASNGTHYPSSSNGNGSANGNGYSNGNGYRHYTDPVDHVDFAEFERAAWAAPGGSSSSNGHQAVSRQDWRERNWREEEEEEEQHAGHEHDQQAGSYYSGAAEEEQQEQGEEQGGLFTDAFKNALKDALARSPLYGVGSGDEEDMPPEPTENEVEVMNRPIFTDSFRMALKDSLARRQAELDKYGDVHGSDDEDPGVPYTAYVPPPPARKAMGPLEEVLFTALNASQHNLRRLNLVKNEVEAMIERETKQIERLNFGIQKAATDEAYYKSLEEMALERKKR